MELELQVHAQVRRLAHLRGHKHVWHVFVLAQKREVQQDFQRLRVGGHDNELGDAAVQCFGCCASRRGGRAIRYHIYNYTPTAYSTEHNLRITNGSLHSLRMQ